MRFSLSEKLFFQKLHFLWNMLNRAKFGLVFAGWLYLKHEPLISYSGQVNFDVGAVWVLLLLSFSIFIKSFWIAGVSFGSLLGARLGFHRWPSIDVLRRANAFELRFFGPVVSLFVVFYLFFIRADTFFCRVFNWDEAGDMSVGYALTQGRVLFIDVWDHHGYGIFLLFKEFFEVFSPHATPFAIHVFNFILILAANILIYRIFLKLKASSLQLVGALMTFNFLYSSSWAKASHGEFYVSFLTATSFYLLFVAKEAFWKRVLAGGLLVTAFLIKQVAIFDIGAFFVIFFMYANYNNLSNSTRLRQFIQILIGGMIVFGLALSHLYSFGVLSQGLYNFFVDPFLYAGIPEGPYLFRVFGSAGKILLFLLETSVLFVVGAVVGSGVVLKKNSSDFATEATIFLGKSVFIWGVFVFVGISLIGRVYSHYLIQLIFPLSLLFSFVYLFKSFLLPLFVAFSFMVVPLMEKDWTEISRLKKTEAEVQKIANYIKDNSCEQDGIYVEQSWFLNLYYLSERLSPTTPFFPTQHDNSFVVRTWGPLIEQIKTNPPKFIIFGEQDTFQTKGLNKYIQEAYALVRFYDAGKHGRIRLFVKLQ